MKNTEEIRNNIMEISTETGSFKALGIMENVLPVLKDGGFTAFDATEVGPMSEILKAEDYLERAKKLRSFADKTGIQCNQSHAPAPTWKKGETAFNRNKFAEIVRCMEVSSVLGAKVCVVHPGNATAEENAEFYLSLEPHARRLGLKIGVENMWNAINTEKGFKATKAACSHPEDFKAHLELLPADVFVACLDIGHVSMFPGEVDCVEMIHTLGDRLQALHIHDNDLCHDDHELPYSRSIQWAPIWNALKDIGYSGDVTLESRSFLPKFPVEVYPSAIRLMAATAEFIRKQLQS